MQTNIPDVYAAGDCCAYQPHVVFSPPMNTAATTTNVNCTSNTTPLVTFNPAPVDAWGNPTTHFFQMRLWTQARLMGLLAAQVMCGKVDDYGTEMQFELFAHVTRFFGYKVVMLGRYNAQGLGANRETVTKELVVTEAGLQRTSSMPAWRESNANSVKTTNELEIWIRVTFQKEFIKLVVLRGKVVGALLIGNTELEEVCENLIMNRLDVSELGIDMLNPDLDLADYFD
mmetsp:Transcript_11237/g.18872  ORF Transcript_11237/g.18872 Transcript_11237/m.18872 type:complete len:229 (+) Transcript_11237:271-957(+)